MQGVAFCGLAPRPAGCLGAPKSSPRTVCPSTATLVACSDSDHISPELENCGGIHRRQTDPIFISHAGVALHDPLIQSVPFSPFFGCTGDTTDHHISPFPNLRSRQHS